MQRWYIDSLEDETVRKIGLLLQALSPEEWQRVLAFMERYVKLHSEPAFKHFHQEKEEQ